MGWAIIAALCLIPACAILARRPGRRESNPQLDVRPGAWSGPGAAQEMSTVEEEREPDVDFDHQVVGSSRYQANLARLAGGKTWEGFQLHVRATVIPEDSNPHDDQAVRVEVRDIAVGYLSRGDARSLRRRFLEAGTEIAPFEAPALIVGGWYRGPDDEGHFGVRLDLRGAAWGRPDRGTRPGSV